MAKTLYLSDLDGTLLRSDERMSTYTLNILNRFIENGGCFSYATARSIVTAERVVGNLNTKVPAICSGGAAIIDSKTKQILISNCFTAAESKFAADVFFAHNFFPIVFAYIDGKEKTSFLKHNITPAMQQYFNSRPSDPRRREVLTPSNLFEGDMFFFACMDTDEALAEINKIFSFDNRFNCIYSKDIYFSYQCCEIYPAQVTKASAALKLKAMLGCDKLVVFGDGQNDLSLFSVADESYAMSNAVPELKKIATAIIDTNDNDGVAKWIEKNLLQKDKL